MLLHEKDVQWGAFVAGGKGHPRISLRGPFEGQSPWNKDTHWAQIDHKIEPNYLRTVSKTKEYIIIRILIEL